MINKITYLLLQSIKKIEITFYQNVYAVGGYKCPYQYWDPKEDKLETITTLQEQKKAHCIVLCISIYQYFTIIS